MIHIHYRIKVRFLGITFGTLEDTKDVTNVVFALLTAVVPQSFKQTVGTLGLNSLQVPLTLYNDRGVFIELV